MQLPVKLAAYAMVHQVMDCPVWHLSNVNFAIVQSVRWKPLCMVLTVYIIHRTPPCMQIIVTACCQKFQVSKPIYNTYLELAF